MCRSFHAPVSSVVGDTLKDFSQDDAAQGQVLIIDNELLQRSDVQQVTASEKIDPNAGVDQDH